MCDNNASAAVAATGDTTVNNSIVAILREKLSKSVKFPEYPTMHGPEDDELEEERQDHI